MASADIAAAWRRGQRGWPSRFVVVQLPNPPLIVGLTGTLLARLGDGPVADYATAIGRLGLAVFAYLELTDGVNWLRRAIGAAVLIALVRQLAGAAR